MTFFAVMANSKMRDKHSDMPLCTAASLEVPVYGPLHLDRSNSPLLSFDVLGRRLWVWLRRPSLFGAHAGASNGR